MSYARDDDEPTPGVEDELGFVSALHLHLNHAIKQQGYPRPQIWRDTEQIEKAEGFDPKIANAINESELLLVVLSRNWPTRPYCLRELELFLARCEAQGWQARERIVVVRKQVVADDECPELHQVTGKTEGYNYFRFNGPKREAGYELPLYWRGQVRHELYHHRCSELGGYLWRAAKRFGGVEPPPPPRRTIYLAKPADDMEIAYLRIANDLMAQGHKVVPSPNEDLPDATCATALIEEAMTTADVSIHLLGEEAASSPEANTLVRTQLACAGRMVSRAAVRGGLKRKFRRIVWAPKISETTASGGSVAFRDPISVLNAFDKYLPGDRVLGDVRSGFLNFLRVELAKLDDDILDQEPAGIEPLEPLKIEAGQTMETVAAKPDILQPDRAKASDRIYVYHKKEDREFARTIARWLKQRHKEPILPGIDDDPDRERLHRKNLIECDAVVLCWAQATDVWTKMQANELRSWSDIGRTREFAYRSLVLGPPPGESKSDDLDLPPRSEIDVIFDLTRDDQLQLEALMPLLNGIQPSHQ